jgi:hypothetical protein
MWNFLKSKLNQIQESDETTKKRWLVLMSAVSMAIIVAVWLFFLSSPIGKIETNRDEAAEETSFVEVFGVGLKSVGGASWNKLVDLYNKAMGKIFIEVEK